MSLDLFSGIPVTDFAASLAWYERLLGAPPTLFATETEALWELAEHRWVYIEQRPERAGHALLSILVADLEAPRRDLGDAGPRAGPVGNVRRHRAQGDLRRSGRQRVRCRRCYSGVRHHLNCG